VSFFRDPRFGAWLADSLRTGLVAVERGGAVAACSPEAARVLGAPGTEADWLGRPAAALLADQPELLALLECALRGHEGPPRAELRLREGPGREARTIGYTLVTVRDGAGELQGAALLFRDLTPFERRDEQARLRERLLALGQMAAGMAHEIRNPLASLEVLAGLLKRELGDRPEALGLVEELGTELRGLAATVTASLEFVRPLALHRETLDPEALLREALERARARRPFAGRASVRVAPGLLPLRGDRERLRGALVNLAENALAAMAEAAPPEGGHRLVLAIEPEGGGGVRISVADTGPGVPAELRERIFYPFFTTREGGSGLGLAEAQKVAASHGGSVEVDEAPGGGAVFRLLLPSAEGLG
jgi:signal transduction histidine kinase